MELEKDQLIKIQTLEMQMKRVEQAIGQLDEQLSEVEGTMNNLENCGSLKAGQETLVSVVNGVFTKATLKEPNTFFVNVGANTVVAKSLDEVKSLVKEQLEEMKKYKAELIQEFQKLVNEAQALDKNITQEKHKELHTQ